MKILLYLLLGLGVLITIVLVRTLLLKETPAKTAKVELDTSSRADEYAEILARMIRKETISDRYNPDRKKFYEFHELLEELFPHVHKTCEKHVFDGSLLFKWNGKANVSCFPYG